MINEMLISKEERDIIRKRDRLRKEGESFIKVLNYGPIGFNYIHAIEDISLIEYNDPDTGRTKFEKKISSSTLIFKEDDLTGDMVADVLDTEFNRYFLARHLELDGKPLFVIENKKLAREIGALVNKEFIVEPTKKELLRRKKVEIERELTHIKHQEEKDRNEEREAKMAAEGKVRTVQENKPKNVIEQPVLEAPEVGV